MIDVKEKIKYATDLGENYLELLVNGISERLCTQTKIRELGYFYDYIEMSEHTIKDEEKEYKIIVYLTSLQLNKTQKSIIIDYIRTIISIKNETTDTNTRERLNEQINQMMKDLNLKWEDIG